MKTKLSAIGILMITAAFSAGLMAGAVHITEPYIRKQNAQFEQTSVLSVFHIPWDKDTAPVLFLNKIKKLKTSYGDAYAYYEHGRLEGIAFKLTGPGFWDTITALIALKPDRKTIMGFSIIAHNETPGLGGRISEQGFLDSFTGKSVSPRVVFIRAGTAHADNEIEAITGATETSRALERIINTNLKHYIESEEIKQL